MDAVCANSAGTTNFVRSTSGHDALYTSAVYVPGMMVYLERKKPQGAPDYSLYEVDRDGLTLWDISQMFGIQLKKLTHYNGFRAGAPLETGDTVILRQR